MFYRSWQSGAPDRVLMLHGLGGHSGWYIKLANALAAKGFDIVVPDFRGFGRSGGLHGHLHHRRQLLDDVAALSAHAWPSGDDRRLHLVGHSLGAIVACHLAGRLVPHSLALLNPWVEDNAQVHPLLAARIAAEGLAGSAHGWALAGGEEGMVDHPAAHEYLRSDPYWVRAQTASFFAQVVLLRLRIMSIARSVSTRTFVVQSGADTVVRHAGSQRLFDTLGSKHKQWAAPARYTHDLQFAEDVSPVTLLLTEWWKQS